MGEPWSFNKYFVAIKRVERSSDVKNLVFDRTDFWIQLHDLPIGSLNVRVAKDVVWIAGVVVGMDAGSDEYEESYLMRVRVGIDVIKLLCKGRKIVLRSGEENWVNFKYKRLPSVCYWCGHLTHHDKDCLDGLRRRGQLRQQTNSLVHGVGN